MNIALIGGKSLDKVKSLISSNIDNIEIVTFSSLQNFVTEANTRTIVVDRFIILQDAVENITDLELVVSRFCDFVLSRYSSSRLVTISKRVEITKVFKKYFIIDDIYTHILVDKATPSLILEVVTFSIKDLDKKYGYKEHEDNENVISEVIDSKEINTGTKDKTEKTSWFSKILKRRGRKESSIDVGNENVSQLQSQKDTGINELNSHEIQEDNEDNIEDSTSFSTNEEMININFNFEGDIGFQLDDETDTNNEGNDLDNLDNLDNNDYEENHLDNFDNLDNKDYEEDTVNLTVIENDELENIENNVTLNIGVKDLPRVNVFEKDLNLDIDVSKISNKANMGDVEIEDVDIALPDIDLEKEVENFEKNNIKVVEKVVEVEKQIKVGGKRFSNIILITGDRRVGKTSLSLNICKELSKNKNVLYVDMDIDRKGSLLYVGFDKILDQDDRVQNGLYLVKSDKALDYVTFYNKKGNFYMLLSMFGLGGSLEDISHTQFVLSTQKKFDIIVIDCPIDYIHLLKDIIYVSDIYVLTHGDTQSIYNVFVDLISKLSEKELIQVIRSSVFLVQDKSLGYDDVLDNILMVDSLFNINSFCDINSIDIQKDIDWFNNY